MSNDYPPQPPSPPNWTRYGQPSYQPPTPPAPAPKPPRLSRTAWFIVNGFIFLVVASSIGVLLLIGVMSHNGLGGKKSTQGHRRECRTIHQQPRPIFGPGALAGVNDFGSTSMAVQSRSGRPHQTGIWQRLSVAGRRGDAPSGAAPLRDSQDRQDGLPHIEELSGCKPHPGRDLEYSDAENSRGSVPAVRCDVRAPASQDHQSAPIVSIRAPNLPRHFTADLFTNAPVPRRSHRARSLSSATSALAQRRPVQSPIAARSVSVSLAD